MQMLYDSDTFVVVYCNQQEDTPNTPRPGFEIVDKIGCRSVYLDGLWAIAFQKHIDKWQKDTPHQDAVEETLESYSQIAHNPLVFH